MEPAAQYIDGKFFDVFYCFAIKNWPCGPFPAHGPQIRARRKKRRSAKKTAADPFCRKTDAYSRLFFYCFAIKNWPCGPLPAHGPQIRARRKKRRSAKKTAADPFCRKMDAYSRLFFIFIVFQKLLFHPHDFARHFETAGRRAGKQKGVLVGGAAFERKGFPRARAPFVEVGIFQHEGQARGILCLF